jgi:hypothetical protein
VGVRRAGLHQFTCPVDEWLAAAFAVERRDETIAAMFEAQVSGGEIDPAGAALRARLAGPGASSHAGVSGQAAGIGL